MEMAPGNETAPLAAPQERRATRRFDMRLPATVKTTDGDLHEIPTETQNVSARGVFLYLDRPVEPGTRLEVTLTFPPHITQTDSVRVRFLARVLRVERAPLAGIGVAAFIEEYEFVRSNTTDPLSDFGKAN